MKIQYYIAKLIKKIHLPAIKKSCIDKKAKVCSGTTIINSKLNKYSYIGNFCTVINVDIGKFCSIADNCIIGGASHPIYWVSTSPIFHKGKNVLRENFSTHEFQTTKKTIIGNDVWIGNNCLIKSGIKIGDGVVIGMGSVVTKDIGPYEIWAGNPAKIIRKRFTENQIEFLLKINWWNLEDEKLKKLARNFTSMEELLNVEEFYENITLG